MKVRDIITARQAEADFLPNRQPIFHYHSLYQQQAESIQADCLSLDANWLIEAHPALWEEMRTLDETLNLMESAGSTEQYHAALAQLAATVREAAKLYENERRATEIPQ